MENWQILVDGAAVGLVAFGLAIVSAQLDGPFGLAQRVRALLSRKWMADWVREGADCPFCHSFYWALLAAVLLANGTWIYVVQIWLVGYGLTTYLLKYTGH